MRGKQPFTYLVFRFFFRRIPAARPTMPVPKSSKLVGSGVTTGLFFFGFPNCKVLPPIATKAAMLGTVLVVRRPVTLRAFADDVARRTTGNNHAKCLIDIPDNLLSSRTCTVHVAFLLQCNI